MLVDGEQLTPPLEMARASYHVVYVTSVPAHYFDADAGSSDMEVALVRIDR